MKSGERTKERIAAAFKKLMIQGPFDGITITDITDECGLNRLTFYYHFQDKYDLMSWIFYKEIIEPLKGNVNADNWADMLYSALKTLKDDSDFYCSSITYDRVELRTYIYDVSEEIMSDVIHDITKEVDVAEEEIEFMSKFFSHGLAGMLFDWISSGMIEDPRDIVKNAVCVVDNCKLYGFAKKSQII